MSTISSPVDGQADTGGSVATTIAAAAKRLWTAFATWRLEQAAIILLNSMSDQDLKDIGVARSEISIAVRGRGQKWDGAAGWDLVRSIGSGAAWARLSRSGG
jgi:uncharacterized protein YjiS (DUF1127 family)